MQLSHVDIFIRSTYDEGTRSGKWAAVLRFPQQNHEQSGSFTGINSDCAELLAVVGAF
jgi:hypothetical protein